MKIRVAGFYTRICGVSKLKEIEDMLNCIGADNILHITSTEEDEMIVVYKEKEEYNANL